MTPTQIYELRQALPCNNPFHTTTQKEFAALLGVSLQAVQAWEQGRKKTQWRSLNLTQAIEPFP